MTNNRKRNLWLADVIPASLVIVLIVVSYRSAWLCDDAYITFRTVDNFVHGYGLTWNIVERVQSFTHPLWALILSAFYFFTREISVTTLLVSIAMSTLAATVLAFRIARTWKLAIVGMAILILSRVFIDYSTSGLENCLTHLLLILFFWQYLKSKQSHSSLTRLSLLAALVGLNRLDALVFVLPPLLYEIWNNHRHGSLKALIIGFLPLIAWECFSVFYYGHILPNSALAKLSTGIGGMALIRQGFIYYLSSLQIDHLTIPVILAAMVVPFISRNQKTILAAIGVILYLIYILKVGGDFMAGRFLSSPLTVAVIILVTTDWTFLRKRWYLTLLIVLSLGLISKTSPLFSGSDYGQGDKFAASKLINGVTDERAFYYSTSKLLARSENILMPWGTEGLQAKAAGAAVIQKQSIGYFGFYAGPEVHIVDEMGLTDPLLSRLPTMQFPQMRIGHFRRKMPDDYIKTIRENKNFLKDPSLAAYYDKIRLVTRGPLWSFGRIIEALKLMAGYYDNLRDAYIESLEPYQLRRLQRVRLSGLNEPRRNGTPWNAPGNYLFSIPGIEIDFEEVCHASEIETCIDNEGTYEVEFYRVDSLLATVPFRPIPGFAYRLLNRRLRVPPEATACGFDRIRLIPDREDKFFSIAYIGIQPVSGPDPEGRR